MATEGKKMFEGLGNPKRTLARREEEAGLGDPKTGTDAGNLPGPVQMDQASFSKYPGKKDTAGLEKALKNRK